MFSMLQNPNTRDKEAGLGGGGYTSVGGHDLFMDAIEAADQRTVMCPLFNGLFTGNTKYLG